MPSFNWRSSADRAIQDRFPEWALGRGVWRDFARVEAIREESLMLLLAGLTQVRSELRRQPPLSDLRRMQCPRLFISHRQADVAPALRIAWLANDAGFEYWLDVLDPTLKAAKPASSLLTAAIIEMALLNCTHVIAVMTPATRGSLWLPYEYGRVKEDLPFSLDAACWLHPKLSPQDFPEYLVLGAQTRSEKSVKRWLATSMSAWQAMYDTCLSGAQEAWTEGPTVPLPAA